MRKRLAVVLTAAALTATVPVPVSGGAVSERFAPTAIASPANDGGARAVARRFLGIAS